MLVEQGKLLLALGTGVAPNAIDGAPGRQQACFEPEGDLPPQDLNQRRGDPAAHHRIVLQA